MQVPYQISEQAKAALWRAYFDHADGTGKYFRLSFNRHGKLGFILDEEKRDDLVEEYEGVKVLLVGQDVLPLIGGAVFELKETATEPVINVKLPETPPATPVDNRVEGEGDGS